MKKKNQRMKIIQIIQGLIFRIVQIQKKIKIKKMKFQVIQKSTQVHILQH